MTLKIQIRANNGLVCNREDQTSTDIIVTLMQPETNKVSFELEGGVRLALYKDGTYQIFGGLLNYPTLEE